MSSPLPDTATLSFHPETAEAAGAAPRCWLLVTEANDATLVPLPPEGEVLIGRAPEVPISLADRTVSRHHARLVRLGDDSRIEDLGSHNGTRVNGERLTAPRLLLSGDVIGICSATLVFSREHGPGGSPVLGLPQLRHRLEEEVDRSLRYLREVAILCAILPPGADRGRALGALGARLRRMDAVGWDGDRLYVLLPELGEAEAREVAAAVQAALAPICGELRIGLALCPEHGSDADSLLGGARAAAALRAEAPALAPEAALRVPAGGRTAVVSDPAMRQVYQLLGRLSQTDLPVLLCGETGTGKELAAAALHEGSPRRGRPFVVVNSAAIQESLAESELFGHRKGAFSGAHEDRQGLIESAHGGTLFLDEVGELSAALQAKLLRVLEDGRVRRVGDDRERAVDLRIVAATNRDLEEDLRTGRFRRDLYFRLRACRVVIPPLRERRSELPLIARALLTDACARAGRPPLELSPAALHALLAHGWPGNVRELKNLMDLLVAMIPEGTVLSHHVATYLRPDEAQPAQPAQPQPGGARFRPIEEELRELERTRMAQALEAAGGVHVRAAELIQMPIRTFTTKVRQYNLSGHPGRPGR